MDEIPTEAYHDVTRVGDVSTSPDGERVAFVTRENDPDEDERVNSIWVAPADGSESPYRLTRASDASSPKWSPDGRYLGFVAARDEDPDLRVGRDADDSEDEGEEEDAQENAESDDAESDEDESDGEAGEGGPKPQLWTFDMRRGGDARQVTDREEGIATFDWAPDGERVVVAARDPTDEEQEHLQQRRDDGPIEVERLQHKFDGAGYLDEVTMYLFVVDVETREETRLDEANDGGYGTDGRFPVAWGPTGRIAYVTNDTENPDDNSVSDVYTIDPDGSDRRKLTDSELGCGHPSWGPDGRLAFTGRDADNYYVPTEVYVGDPDDGEFESVSAELDRTVAYGGGPQWVADDRLLALVGDEGRTRLVELDPDGDRPAERTYQRQGDYESLTGLDVGGSTVGLVVDTPDRGVDVHTLGAADLGAAPENEDPRTQVSAVNDEFVSEHPAPGCRRLTFESDDGQEVEALAYYPADFDPEDPDERALVLNIHGGPMAYDAPGFRFQDWYFTSRGYVVLKVNYRGSTSYGREFCETLKGAWGGKEVMDLQAGVDELIDRGWADPDRLFPTGFSQGGVNTGYLVTRDDRWAAAAAEHGIYDYRACFGTDDSHVWWESDYGLPWENPEAYEAASSITDVGDVETPLLVTAGDSDWRCPPSQAEQLYVSVRKQGVDAKLVVYQNEHHNVGDPDRAVHRLEELRDWFAEYDPERDTDDEDD